jgi:outer membrane protein OmpA-like peptidoglycan-associated protein/opacity protein-like surface antigen
MRVVLAVGALAAIVPALAGAQQRPPAQQPRPTTPPAAQPRPATPPAQRPAAQPAQRPAMATTGVHREGSFELSVGAGLNTFDKQITANQFGGAGFLRAGYNFTNALGVSVGTGVGKIDGHMVYAPFADLTYTFDLNQKFRPFFLVGAGITKIQDRATSTYGAHLGAGVRSFLSDNLALRVEGRMGYEHFDEFGGIHAYNGSASAGLSFFMGGGPPKDTDADGVPDKKDKCPNTPRGAHVFPIGNARAGCPIDSDNDGVWDGLDQCPNTPPNARPVYPIGNPRAGCPVDSDNDGVADYLDRCPNTPANARPIDANGCPVDSDGDGVADYLDRCPNTPTNARPVDATGCPVDSDHDGVPDYLDRCPNTPPNARPLDANGCPVDSDHDGVADYLDRCPNTAPNTQVDANGCPVQRDSDNDGVTDDRDRCPNTPANTRVDEFGCPYHELPAAGAALVIRNITFRNNTAILLPTSNAELDKIATAVLSVPNSRWEVGGYTDNRGIPAANQRLSMQRANAVMQYLISKGVPQAALTAVGYGAQHPVAPNTTAAGRANNRRVEMKRLQ